MVAADLKQKYLDFFIKKGHAKLPNVSLVPEVDSSVLFITAGMHPLVPYLLGEPHPLGKRLVSVQRCLRTDDIDNVGDGFHHTFFEMLGNWSLGEYWKKEAITWSWEFLTKVLDFDPKTIHVSCFKGDTDAPKDEESAKIWQTVGVPPEKIHFFGKKENWWGPVGNTGPCGPDSEMFIDTGKEPCGPNCDPSCQCGKYIEVWNNVFMQYNRTSEGKFEPLKQKNVDTGMGIDRVTALTSGFGEDDYKTEQFWPIIEKIEELSGKQYEEKIWKSFRVIADHLRAATFLIADGVTPSNVEQGYVLRRLIRRAVRAGRQLGIKDSFTPDLAGLVVTNYRKEYPHLETARAKILAELTAEETKFAQALERGTREFDRLAAKIGSGRTLSGETAFHLFESFGFPLELTKEMAAEKGLAVDEPGFAKAKDDHQQKSRESTSGKFTGGLADHSVETTKLHTAAHLLHQALRNGLGDHVRQAGQNITAQRLRFDFTHPKALTEEEKQKIEIEINAQIDADLPVKMEMMKLEEAKKRGALALFGEKYREEVKTYAVGDPSAGSGQVYSFEVCGGPHVASTGEIGHVKIVREKAVGEGRRRVYVEIVK